jgi:hypothetical protein
MRDDIGNGFVVVDTVAIKIHEFASRQEAERECDARNNIGRQKTSEPAELPVLREKLRKGGFLTPEESAVLNRPRDKDLKPIRPRSDPQVFIDQMRKALPALCRAWGSELARQAGIDDVQRRAMTTDEVVARVGLADTGDFSAQFYLETLAEEFRDLRWTCLEDEGFRGVIAVNYLSSEPARLKASYLGLSERSYFRKLEECHQWLARCLAAKYGSVIDLDESAPWAMLRDIADGGRIPDDDPQDLSPEEFRGFSVEKWPF